MKYLWAALVSLMVMPATHAADTEGPRFSGFGTVGAAFSDNDGGDYTANFEQREGVGLTTTKDYGLDSIFGVQADLTLLDGLQATAQMQSRRLADGSSTPYFEWANLKYHFNEDLSLRVGRVVAPMFMVSESRAIGYSQITARLAPDVYQINPVSYLDGGGINYRFEFNDVLFSANTTLGKFKKALPTFFGELTTEFDARLINLSAESGASTFRVGYVDAVANFSADLLNLVDFSLTEMINAGVPNAALVDRHLQIEAFKAAFFDLGYTYDPGDYVVQAEYVIRRTDSFIVYDVDGFFVLGAVRLDSWTPFLRYAQVDDLNDKKSAPSIDATGFGAPFTDYATTVNIFTDVLKTYDERNTWTLGTRWDLADNYALKLQYDRVTKPSGQSGLFINATPEFIASKQSVDVYSITLDFIF